MGEFNNILIIDFKNNLKEITKDSADTLIYHKLYSNVDIFNYFDFIRSNFYTYLDVLKLISLGNCDVTFTSDQGYNLSVDDTNSPVIIKDEVFEEFIIPFDEFIYDKFCVNKSFCGVYDLFRKTWSFYEIKKRSSEIKSIEFDFNKISSVDRNQSSVI